MVDPPDLLADALPRRHRLFRRALVGTGAFFSGAPLGDMEARMQVNVFVLKAGNDSGPTLLLLPDNKPRMTIPEHLRPWGWQYFITTVSADDLIGRSPLVVDELLERDGYVLVPATTAKRPSDKLCLDQPPYSSYPDVNL
jgi:hypothetical protein